MLLQPPTGSFQIIGRILPNYWQDPVNSKEGSFERYERILQGPLLINKQTGFVFVLLQGTRMATQTNYWQDPSKIGRSLWTQRKLFSFIFLSLDSAIALAYILQLYLVKYLSQWIWLELATASLACTYIDLVCEL